MLMKVQPAAIQRNTEGRCIQCNRYICLVVHAMEIPAEGLFAAERIEPTEEIKETVIEYDPEWL